MRTNDLSEDQKLDMISASLKRIKNHAIHTNKELDKQDKLLSQINTEVDNSQTFLNKTFKRLTRFINSL